MNTVIIGAGIGGLTTAAVLARQGIPVTVLEAHVYPGGCAGTFYHQGYQFDAGATLAGGFYPGGPMDLVANAAGIEDWGAHPSDPAMAVHLPDGQRILRFGDQRRHAEHERVFGKESRRFWDWQESTSDALWELALARPEWPPQNLEQAVRLGRTGLDWLARDPRYRLSPGLIADALRQISAHLNRMPDDLRWFVDAQLLISAQTTSQYANALYAASALDLPRRGVVHFDQGMGAIAEKLVHAIRSAGGKVLFRQTAQKIRLENGLPKAVITTRDEFPADRIIFNLPPWNIAGMFDPGGLPGPLKSLPSQPADAWGAFVLYVGVDESAIHTSEVLHHQVIARRPMGEANTAFISLSPAGSTQRAPDGQRAITISTHTRLQPWWDLYESDRTAYDSRKQAYTEKLLDLAESVFPSIRSASRLVLPGTPVTFQRFTRRVNGWVGGFPQTSLFRLWGPRLGRQLWMVGDSIFPGQSTTAVALGGLRVAGDVAHSVGASLPEFRSTATCGGEYATAGD